MNKALEQAKGVLETDEDVDLKTAICKAKEYCCKVSSDDVVLGFNALLESLRITSMTDDAVVIEADSALVTNTVRSLYLNPLKRVFTEILGYEVDVEIKMDK